MPYFEREVEIRRIPDDGSDRWEALAKRVVDEPVIEASTLFA